MSVTVITQLLIYPALARLPHEFRIACMFVVFSCALLGRKTFNLSGTYKCSVLIVKFEHNQQLCHPMQETRFAIFYTIMSSVQIPCFKTKVSQNVFLSGTEAQTGVMFVLTIPCLANNCCVLLLFLKGYEVFIKLTN